MKKPHRKIRLFVPGDLSLGSLVCLSKEQSHYVSRVMRQSPGDLVLLFNGRHGEWLAIIEDVSKTACGLKLMEQSRAQVAEPDIWVVFAPIKKTRLDFLVEKATELGASRLIPILTERTDVKRVNVDRLSATAMEAAEQSERLSVPIITQPVSLHDLIEGWPENRRLFIMDETGRGEPAASAFISHRETSESNTLAAIMVGPEGGFSGSELDAVRNLPFVTRVTLGVRVLRAETAVAAALSNWQMLAGDGCVVRNR